MKDEKIKDIIKEEVQVVLKEASMQRVRDMSAKHDTGYITAFRGDSVRKKNVLLNKQLRAKLGSYQMGITTVQGSYIEDYGTPNAREVGESTYFVVDLNDRGDLKKLLMKLGHEYEQDSILFVYKGGKKSELIGTMPDVWPGMGKIKKHKNAVFGKSGEYMTRIHGRPFVFKEAVGSMRACHTNMGRWAASTEARELQEAIDALNEKENK